MKTLFDFIRSYRWMVQILVVVLSLSSCMDNKKRGATAELSLEWIGKEIRFPKNTPCFVSGRDTLSGLCMGNLQKEFKILFYVDSAGCNSCRMKLLEWQQLIAETEALFPDKVGFLFFFQPKSAKEMNDLLLAGRFDYPVFIDTADSVNCLNQFSQVKPSRLNQFPKSMQNQCFLLDKDNKVLALGNPALSLRVWESYKTIMEGGGNSGTRVQTSVGIDTTVHDFGAIRKGVVSSTIFTAVNNGNSPLMITRISTSCGCTAVAWDRELIKPGGNTAIRVEITPNEAGFFNKNLVVYCNAANSPIVLTVKGIAR